MSVLPHVPHHDPLDPLHIKHSYLPASASQPQLDSASAQPQDSQQHYTHSHNELPFLQCGPLLRFCGLDYPDEQGREEKSSAPTWRGSVLLVVEGTIEDNAPAPQLVYTTEVVAHGHHHRSKEDEGIGMAIGEDASGRGTSSENGSHRDRRDSGFHHSGKTFTDEQGTTRRFVTAKSKLILAENRSLAYRYDIIVPLEEEERMVTYMIQGVRKQLPNSDNDSQSSSSTQVHTSTEPITTTFYIPSITSNMRILFHSCNGFSAGTDEAAWSGPALWNDVCRTQSNPTTAYHVMIGGGDQIYSDEIRVSGPLKDWAKIGNPSKRRAHPYTQELSLQVNKWYLENYIKWYTTPPFAHANGRIPQVNMWDDHDIIDGYGSYTDHFMRSPVFIGIGRAAWRFYMVFQHHTPPEGESDTVTRSNDTQQQQQQQQEPLYQSQQQSQQPQTEKSNSDADEDPSWIFSPQKGRYIGQRGRSIYARLGRNIALLALDARTERTRHEICPPETYNTVFSRLEKEITAAGQGTIKHLLILLGVPIAYPRLVWLETVLRSPIFGAFKFLNKRFGFNTAAFNKFDGEVDILDDLDDHWAARVHKAERTGLIERWQNLADRFNVRVTILSGDVHLAAVGRFYTRVPVPKRFNLCKFPGSKSDGTIDPADIENEQQELERLAKDFRYTPNIISSAITNKPPPAAVSRLLARRNKVHHLGPTEEVLVGLFKEDVDGSNKGKSAVTMPRRNYTSLRVGEEGDDGLAEGRGVGTRELHGGRKERERGIGKEGDELRVEIRIEMSREDPEGKTKGYGFIIPALVR